MIPTFLDLVVSFSFVKRREFNFSLVDSYDSCTAIGAFPLNLFLFSKLRGALNPPYYHGRLILNKIDLIQVSLCLHILLSPFFNT